jgi:CRISPR-associated endonuclease/helicase Cas3
MRGRPADFWGKLSTDREQWHPLIDHCADVAACCEALLRRRLAKVGGLDHLSPVQVARLCVLAADHDFGKFNFGFQNKTLERSPFTNGHVREALALFGNRYADSKRLRSSLALGEIERWGSGDGAIRLLIAAIAHHGKLADVADCDREYRALQWKPARGLDPFDGISRLAAHARSWYPAAFFTSLDPLPAASAFQHAFSGLVTLADWLGSDTRLSRSAKREMETGWCSPAKHRSARS